jgi:hypothetical protein
MLALHLGTSLHGSIHTFWPFSEHGTSLEDLYTLHHINPNLYNQYQDPQHTHNGNLPPCYREIKELVIYQKNILMLASSLRLTANPGDEIRMLHRPLYQRVHNSLGSFDLNHFLLNTNKQITSFFINYQ